MQEGTSTLLQSWRHTTREAGGSLVLPDGCVDLIGFQRPGTAPNWKLSPLMDCSCRIHSPAGQRFAGFRLHPGVRVNGLALLRAVEGLELDDTHALLERLDSATSRDARVSEALQALATERDLRLAQRQLGVNERSLQRLIGSATGRAPLYWKRLARLRRAARAVAAPIPLAQVAAEHGFADQAHMNREFRHWLGLTPVRVGLDLDLQRLLREKGYG